MHVRVYRKGGVTVMSFDGDATLDCAAAEDVRAQAIRQIDGRADLVIDLSSIEFIDSAGMGVLVGIYKRVKLRGCRVAIAGARPDVARVMGIIKLDQVFERFTDVKSALEVLAPCESVGAGETETPR